MISRAHECRIGVKITNLLDPLKSVEVEAVIDTGATMVVLPQNIVQELDLRKVRETKVRYADNRTESKSIYGVITLEIKGRTGNFDVLAEVEGSQPLIGQVVLEILDLVVDPRTRRLIPNPSVPQYSSTPGGSGGMEWWSNGGNKVNQKQEGSVYHVEQFIGH